MDDVDVVDVYRRYLWGQRATGVVFGYQGGLGEGEG